MKTAIVLEHKRCLAARSSQPNASISGIDRSTCGEKFSANWNRNADDRWKKRAAFTLAYTLVPIPVVWLMVCGLIATARKVRSK
jgi:hypothetical protein